MPEKATVQKARRDLRAGKRPTTAAGAFVREELHHVRAGKHGARSPEQAIAIGLSKARRAGVPLPPPGRGAATRETRESAARAYEVGQGERAPRAPSRRRARATRRALEREPREAAGSKKSKSKKKKTARRGGSRGVASSMREVARDLTRAARRGRERAPCVRSRRTA